MEMPRCQHRRRLSIALFGWSDICLRVSSTYVTFLQLRLTNINCIDVLIHMDAEQLHIQPSASEPIFRQISEQIRRLASAGQLQPGEALPSVREVAATHAINPMTVSRAYSQLEAEGVLQRQRGRGMVVAASAATHAPQAERLQQLEPQLHELARQSRELGLPAEYVLKRLQHLLGTTTDE
jgi:GntR family transcriptional regulator